MQGSQRILNPKTKVFASKLIRTQPFSSVGAKRTTAIEINKNKFNVNSKP
jgi:hypothetical protein